jgi:hypothetical protein
MVKCKSWIDLIHLLFKLADYQSHHDLSREVLGAAAYLAPYKKTVLAKSVLTPPHQN